MPVKILFKKSQREDISESKGRGVKWWKIFWWKELCLFNLCTKLRTFNSKKRHLNDNYEREQPLVSVIRQGLDVAQQIEEHPLHSDAFKGSFSKTRLNCQKSASLDHHQAPSRAWLLVAPNGYRSTSPKVTISGHSRSREQLKLRELRHL